MQDRNRRMRAVATVVLALTLMSACSGSQERPTAATWSGVWESRQGLIPTAEVILDQGQDLCGERLGRFRTAMPALLPAPTEALDTAVDEWISHAETIVFECPSDPVDLADRFETLDVLAAEVDAGLGAATNG